VTQTASRDFTSAWETFFRTSRRLRARVGRLPFEGLSLAQYQLLEALRHTPELTVGELAESAGVAPPTATRMLDCLARDGLVSRRHSEEDRRAVLVSLTGAGTTVLAAAHEEVEAFRRRMFESLADDEREQATRLLNRLTEVLEDNLP
jgi:MarR family transcriptional regulator, organic hydroperoxide resistance regulator